LTNVYELVPQKDNGNIDSKCTRTVFIGVWFIRAVPWWHYDYISRSIESKSTRTVFIGVWFIRAVPWWPKDNM